ncbi:MAG: SsrA-binding protein SmpB [Deltaproteobacteria bacterium]|nr:SsrA-binding protein SmpB [Deltaproteobacteria bacterium]
MGKKKKNKKDQPGELMVCTNSRALMRYNIGERIEAGIVLSGSEVKSMRAKRADLEGSYATIDGGELWLHKMYVGPYEQAGPFGHEAKQRRKLLVKSQEIKRLIGKLTVRGFTLIPIRVYFKNGWAKVELGLAKGKDVGDRRQDLKSKTAVREARAAVDAERRR